MLSKARKKLIKSLAVKKYRDNEGLFTVEGEKSVAELLQSSLNVVELYCTPQSSINSDSKANIITESEMEQISNLKTPSTVIAIVKIPTVYIDPEIFKNELVIALDGLQDPGNLGTIIRIADWYGIKNIICSPNTVDVFNPKTIQATMGAFTRVNIFYTGLTDLLFKLNSDIAVFGTFLNGENIYKSALPTNGIIVIGNEGNGISEDVEKLLTRKLFIPYYPPHKQNSESLNAAVATAIVCSEFRRKLF